LFFNPANRNLKLLINHTIETKTFGASSALVNASPLEFYIWKKKY